MIELNIIKHSRNILMQMHYSARNMFNKVTHMWHYMSDRKHNMYDANMSSLQFLQNFIKSTLKVYISIIRRIYINLIKE